MLAGAGTPDRAPCAEIYCLTASVGGSALPEPATSTTVRTAEPVTDAAVLTAAPVTEAAAPTTVPAAEKTEQA